MLVNHEEKTTTRAANSPIIHTYTINTFLRSKCNVTNRSMKKRSAWATMKIHGPHEDESIASPKILPRTP